MAGLIHLVKLSVGSEGVEDLRAWQATKRAQAEDGAPRHVTRMWPKREADLLNGGSIYWVIEGQLRCRQKILRLDEIYREDGIRRCAIVLDPGVPSAAPSRWFVWANTAALWRWREGLPR